MSKTNQKTSKAQELYVSIVNEFISKLEQGINPFVFGRIQPISMTTGKPYTNLNKMFLVYIANKNGFNSAKWATMNQINKAGGRVLKGSSSTPIFFFSKTWAVEAIKKGEPVTIWSKQQHKEDAIAEVNSQKGVTAVKGASQKTVLNFFKVFNLDQTTLEDQDIIAKPEQPSALKVAIGNHIDHKDGEQIKYDEKLDCIYGAIGDSLLFDFSQYYKSVIQATGSANRLNRETEYAEEELIKLIGSSYLLGMTGLDQSPVSPQLAEVFVNKLKTSPNSLWKYARLADEAYGMVSGWLEELMAAKGAA